MPFRYTPETRRTMCDRMLKSERVESLFVETGIAVVTLYRWKKQALVDAGLAPGVKSHEIDELAKAQRRIRQLESELEIVKAHRGLHRQFLQPTPSTQFSRLPHAGRVRRSMVAPTNCHICHIRGPLNGAQVNWSRFRGSG
jgi:transposase